VGKIVAAVHAARAALPPCDLVVVVASGSAALYDSGTADLSGIGRPDIVADAAVASEAVARLSAGTLYPMLRGTPLPLDLAVLLLLLDSAAPVVPMTVPASAGFEALTGIGAAIARSLADLSVRAGIVVAGDLSTGLTEKSPRHLVPGAIFWDEQAVAAVDGGRLDGLGRLGPEEAARVGASGWAPLAVLHGATARAKLGMVVRHYSAPRGAGYLVAHGG